MRLAGWIVGIWLGLLTAAWAAIGTPTQLGTASGTTTAVITTGATAPAGSLIVVVVSSGTSNIPVTSVVDSVANCTTYTGLDNTNVASRPTLAFFYCPNVGLVSGQTITATVPAGDKVAATAFYVSGMSVAPADASGHAVNGAAGPPASSTSSGVLAQQYELLIGGLALAGSSSALVPGNSFTSVGGVGSANGSAYAAWKVTCTTASQAWAPSWTTSNAYMSDVVSFKAASADTMCASKSNDYAVLQAGTAGQISASKSNLYVVLQAQNPGSGLFHSFPP